VPFSSTIVAVSSPVTASSKPTDQPACLPVSFAAL
jgi:hypothetical protein